MSIDVGDVMNAWFKDIGRTQKRVEAQLLRMARVATVGVASGVLFGCSVAGPAADQLNPFSADANSGGFGQRNTNAILGAGGGGGGAAERARHALEVAGSYRRAHAPQPVYPVIRPAEVRLMWIPDHQTLDGNLVPAHYYYLKVLHDDWELQDAFEIEGQLNNTGTGNVDYGTSGGGGTPVGNYGGATPWVYKDKR